MGLLIASAQATLPPINFATAYNLNLPCIQCATTQNKYCIKSSGTGGTFDLFMAPVANAAAGPVYAGADTDTGICCGAGANADCTWTAVQPADELEFACTDTTGDFNLQLMGCPY